MADSLFKRLIKKLVGGYSDTHIKKNDTIIETISENAEKEDRNKQNIDVNLHKKSNDRSLTRDLYIGFDLGTSCSKVIVRDNIDQYAFPINFGKWGFNSNSYLLPTRIYISGGTLSLSQINSDDKVVYDMKSNFINTIELKNSIVSTDVTLISYLSMAFYIIRKKVFEERNIYKKSKINWHINLGAPCINIKNNELIKRYEDVIFNAWNLSFEKVIIKDDMIINADLINNYLNNITQGIIITNNEMRNFIYVFPELFAAIKSQTSQKRLEMNKMYYMIDIGASTVDMATFNLFENDNSDNNHAIFVPEIRSIGSYNFGLELIKELSNNEAEKDNFHNIIVSLAEGNSNYDLCQNFGLNVLDNIVYKKYEKEYRDQIGKTIMYTKNEYYPNAPEWQSGIPTFIVGGGANFIFNGYKFYETVLIDKFCVFSSYGIVGPKLIKSYPPTYFVENEIISKNYYRFLVADGLAHDKYSLGIVFDNVNKLPKREATTLDLDEIFIGQEMT